ncbi:hypothetical protein OG301_22975 [Streptomyces platensis]|uniref:hypothetical protein n=1 Tax=Streptomyces platensis TaxID=58346 RepID=UPI002E81BADF|nr:hypothetical protein [Streptomyces platensis]WTI53994.1 hypothetical protein OG301_22975 [Streptomyces platensis]WUB80401.1 hypothetical protein OG424_15135 [Streptomyces platensis]
MGIESDQLVFDYLSRVGDLAQQRGLPAATRMRLVTGLRAEIDGEQADSVSGVKRLLARLGTPDAVVAAAGSADDRVPGAAWSGAAARQEPGAGTADGPAVPLGPRPAEPLRRWSGARDKLTGLAARSGLTGKAAGNGEAPTGGSVPAPRDGAPDPAPTVGLPPHLAGADELGDAEDAPDWWRVEPAPFGPGETVPGFVGGIEIPEMWDRPEDERPLSLTKDGADGAAGGDGQAADGGGPAERPLPRMLRRALGRRRAAPAPPVEAEAAEEVVAPARAPLSPVLTLAVLLLVAGAALGSWLALAGGWGLAYVSRRLTRAEAKFAALGVPGTVVGGLVVWLWGRFDGRWGEPLAQGRLGAEMLAGLPVMARVAAVASALFLVWRMRRIPR